MATPEGTGSGGSGSCSGIPLPRGTLGSLELSTPDNPVPKYAAERHPLHTRLYSGVSGIPAMLVAGSCIRSAKMEKARLRACALDRCGNALLPGAGRRVRAGGKRHDRWSGGGLDGGALPGARRRPKRRPVRFEPPRPNPRRPVPSEVLPVRGYTHQKAGNGEPRVRWSIAAHAAQRPEVRDLGKLINMQLGGWRPEVMPR
jgi:hypothetical protein